MRDIKFRAWDKRHNQMVSWIDLADIPYARENFFHYTDKEQVFMQFTGLLDKSGVEIWEGDIVKQKGCRFCKCEPTILEVKYKEFYHYKGEGIGYTFWEIDSKYLEVIGNIYESPNLLKGATK